MKKEVIEVEILEINDSVCIDDDDMDIGIIIDIDGTKEFPVYKVKTANGVVKSLQKNRVSYIESNHTLQKCIVYLNDFKEGFNPYEGLKTLINNDKYLNGEIVLVDSVDILWHDGIDINQQNSTINDIERYFIKKEND